MSTPCSEAQYAPGDEVELKRATHDGWIWVKGTVVSVKPYQIRAALSDGVPHTYRNHEVRRPVR